MTAPLASMTGFARTEGMADRLAWVWELRSVNGRGLDLRFRLPPGFDAAEPGLRERAAGQLRRGNVSATLTVRREETVRLAADPAALEQVLSLALSLAARIPDAPPPRAEALLALPGVLRAATSDAVDDGIGEAQIAVVADGFSRALEALVAMRRAEGARLSAMLTGHASDHRCAAPRNGATTASLATPVPE